MHEPKGLDQRPQRATLQNKSRSREQIGEQEGKKGQLWALTTRLDVVLGAFEAWLPFAAGCFQLLGGSLFRKRVPYFLIHPSGRQSSLNSQSRQVLTDFFGWSEMSWLPTDRDDQKGQVFCMRYLGTDTCVGKQGLKGMGNLACRFVIICEPRNWLRSSLLVNSLPPA